MASVNNLSYSSSNADVRTSLLYSFDTQKCENIDDIFEILFHIKRRETSILSEIYYGFIQFISCIYVLPVIPNQLSVAGYNKENTVNAIALSCGLGCIVAGLFANLPFVIAPPTSISIFLAIFLQQESLQRNDGKLGVIISGILLMFLGWRPLGRLVTKLIPLPIQAGTAIGIGLITALAGATEVNLVISGKFSILDMGYMSVDMAIALTGLVIVTIALHYHVKGAFVLALIFGTVITWTYKSTWPKNYVQGFSTEKDWYVLDWSRMVKRSSIILIFDLLFLYVLTLNGLARSLSDLSTLTRLDGTIPRGRWLFIVCGVATIVSGFLGGPPILLSPESAAGIKAGARTGLSTMVCGFLFILSNFFSPIFIAVPAAGTSPLLIIVGVILFQNVLRIEWHVMRDAVPAYCVLFFIPFTYSVLEGIVFGYAMYICIGLLTGDLYTNTALLIRLYFDIADPVPIDNKIDTLLDLRCEYKELRSESGSHDINTISIADEDHNNQEASSSEGPVGATGLTSRPPRNRNRNTASSIWAMDMPSGDVVVNMGYAEMLDDPRIRSRTYSSSSPTSAMTTSSSHSKVGPSGFGRRKASLQINTGDTIFEEDDFKVDNRRSGGSSIAPIIVSAARTTPATTTTGRTVNDLINLIDDEDYLGES